MKIEAKITVQVFHRFDESQIDRILKGIRMAKQEMLDAIAEAKQAVVDMKAAVATDLEEIIRRLQAGDPTAEVVAAVKDVIADIKGVDILPDFPAPPPPVEPPV